MINKQLDSSSKGDLRKFPKESVLNIIVVKQATFWSFFYYKHDKQKSDFIKFEFLIFTSVFPSGPCR